MEKFGNFLRAIAESLRNGVRLAGQMSAEAIDGIAGIIASMFRRRSLESTEEVVAPDAAGESVADGVADAVRRIQKDDQKAMEKPIASPAPAALSVGERIQLACRRLEAGQPLGAPFSGMRAEAALLLYVTALTAPDRQVILSYPASKITWHFMTPGSRLLGVKSWHAFNPAAEHESRRTNGWTTADYYEERRQAIIDDDGHDSVDWHEIWTECEQIAGERETMAA